MVANIAAVLLLLLLPALANGELIHQYKIEFLSNAGNVEALEVDTAHLASDGDAGVEVDAFATANATSLEYGDCVLPADASSHEICGLQSSQTYFVRVFALNEVPAQGNEKWSGILPAIPQDQVPDPPSSFEALVLSSDGLQILFDWPARDGGQPITDFVVTYDTKEDFSSPHEMSIAPSLPQVIPGSSDRYIFDLVPTSPPFTPGETYYLKMAAENSVGLGVASLTTYGASSGPLAPPSAAVLTTLDQSDMPVTEATVSWAPPLSTGGYPINGYLVEWWSEEKLPEVQTVRLLYTSQLSETTFTLSYSPSPTVKRETSNLPWNVSADLVRRALLNLGWNENDDLLLISDVEVSRTTLANGYQWTITFGDNLDRSLNDGDQASLSASVMDNGDAGSPTITVSTSQDGRRPGGRNEVQYLQVVGTGTLSGFYRMKFEGSVWSAHIPVNADAVTIQKALEQLSTIGEVTVTQNDSVDQSQIGTGGDLVHHYAITFVSNSGNVEALVVDATPIVSPDGNANVIIVDGSNSLDTLNTKDSAAIPGELPVHYGSALVDATADSYKITGLVTGLEYFVAVSASNAVHGHSHRLLPTPSSITPPLQTPGSPTQVSLDVNSGYSDSLVVSFDPPESDGGSEILFYRVELDPTPSFDSPIVQDFYCPAGNRRTEWEVETSVDGGGVISGGSFRLELEVDGFSSVTAEIPYDAVALASNETGIFEELLPNLSTTANSNALSTIPPVDIEGVLFPGDRLRFSGQSAPYKYYEVQSVTGTSAVLTESFLGDDGVQVSTTRHYGGRGSPLSSRVHCTYDADLCPDEDKSGSMQSKLEALTTAIESGVSVDREGPRSDNSFIWRVTFLDDAYPQGSDFDLSVHSTSLTATAGTAQVATSLLNSGHTYSSCTGSLVTPTYGGLVKGLLYNARVSARNNEGYSLPAAAPLAVAPKVIPSAPTGVTLDVVSATELRVIFGSPADNGGDTITSYLIEWSLSSSFAEAESSTLVYLAGGSPFFVNIDGLTTGESYYVRVRARNSQGYGISQMSTPSSLNPHQKPAPPTNVRLGVTSSTMLTVGWQAPLSNGGDLIQKYRIEWDTRASFASSSAPPHKGYIDVDADVWSQTLQLLSDEKSYYLKVYASNTAGFSSGQLATPSDATPANQPPGSPHSLLASSGSAIGAIEVSWQRPRIPAHNIPCSNNGATILDCPTPYGGSIPASDGGQDVYEYELEWNERVDFLGSDGGRKTYVGTHAVLTNLYPGRTYFVRVLARNAVGSGKYGHVVATTAKQ
ncbi:hypothetical protein ACHAXT_007520 [Thalassiosira profunda]